MDERGEGSLSRQLFSNEVNHAPVTVTPSKVSQPDPNQTWKTWLRNPFDELVYENNGGIYNKFSMDDVETWNSVSVRDLLALADGTIRNSSGDSSRDGCGCDGGGSRTQQYGRLNAVCDLNLPPQMVNEPLMNTGLSLQFRLLTPDVTKRAERKQAAPDNDGSILVEADQDFEKGLTEQTNQNKILQQELKRRKHRPKVVTEGKLNQHAKRICKRKIHFVESENQAEETTDKTCEMTGEGVKNYQGTTTGKITPNKTELPHGKLKGNYKKSRRKIDFLQERSFDKRPSSHVAGPNESRLSSSVCLNKGDEAHRSKGDISSEIDRIKLLYERTSALFHDSLESFLSVYADYNHGRKQAMQLSAINKGKTCETSKDRYVDTHCQNSKNKKGDEAHRSEGDISSEIDRIKLLHEQTATLFHDSLESFLSVYADYNRGRKLGMQLSAINKGKAPEPSKGGYMDTDGPNSRNKKGDGARRSKGDVSSEMDRIKHLDEQTLAVFQDSLESFLSEYTDFNTVSKQPVPLSINKGKAPETSKARYMLTDGQNSKNNKGDRAWRSKGDVSSEMDRIKLLDEQTLALFHDPLESFLSKYTDFNTMAPSLYHGHKGYKPTLRCESLIEIDVLVYRLECLHISSDE